LARHFHRLELFGPQSPPDHPVGLVAGLAQPPVLSRFVYRHSCFSFSIMFWANDATTVV
jgi:hypothetical protein